MRSSASKEALTKQACVALLQIVGADS